LHDRLGQDLASIKLNLQLIKAQLETERQSRLGPRLDDSISLVERAVESVRCVAAALRPALLDDRGLAETLKSYCEQYSVRTGVRVLLAVKRPVARLEHDVAMTLFRITQEALTNVMKHAGAASARVTLVTDAKSASLAIEDDGRGFDAGAGARATSVPNGLGLLIMEQRLRAVGGSLRVVSSPGTGTRVNATVRRMK
jgi:signal transduction histidine kinase